MPSSAKNRCIGGGICFDFCRDNYGNPTNVIANDDFGNHREACITYESKGIFPWAFRNPAGHTSHVLHERGLGVAVAARGPNGLVTKSKIDTFGRTLEIHAPDGLITSITRTRVKSGQWTTRVSESTPGHGSTETVFDALGRVSQQRIRGPDIDTAGFSAFGNGVWIVQDRKYDKLGHLSWQSIPRIDGDVGAESMGTTYEYDNASRPTSISAPWRATKYAYDHDDVMQVEPGPAGITTIATITQTDALGRVVSVTDAKGGITQYEYGPFGQVRRVVLPDGTFRETLSDAYGRAKTENDPDRGKTLLEFNGFDEVIHLHDALGRHYSFERDGLGRMTKRSEGLNISTYEFDTAANGIGLLAKTLGADGHEETYEYDALSRITKKRLQLADGRTFEHGRSYDPFGHLLRRTYPNGMSVVHDYDSIGTLKEIRNGLTRDPLWSREMVDVVGQTMFERFGNGATTERVYQDGPNVLETMFTTGGGKTLQSLRYDYDAQLNVKSRFDALQGKREVARYDALNRVTCTLMDTCAPGGACVDMPAACDVAVKYGPNGDIVSKSDVGVYVQDAVHPHAVRSAGMKQFAYDAVGNQIERPGQTITYTDFDLPRQYIPRNGNAPTVFEYSATGQRLRQERGEHETIYFDDVYELDTTGNTTTERFYVANDERVVAIMERSSSGDTWQFVHVDHVGSVDVLTDNAGNEIERRSYDVWGAPRSPQWGGNGLPPTNALRRGFTGHEHDEGGLVNAKGRIYDPTIAQFLQTDPVIGDALDAQTYHPYSYVYNRPLVFTDPSGFEASYNAEAWRLWRAEDVGTLGLRVTFDKLTPPAPRRESAASTAAEGGAPAPSTAAADSSAPDVVQLPVIETVHPSGQGTDDPFGVFPADIELDRTPISTFDQLLTGEPGAGRTTFVIEDDPGITRDLRYAFGPARQTILLRRTTSSGDASDYQSRAVQDLVGETILTAATLLTPGPLDDMAAAGLRGAARVEVEAEVGAVRAGRAIHNGSLDTTKPAVGYSLRDRTTDAILKYGETTQPKRRYTERYLNSIKAVLRREADGSKREMHYWQHNKILEYKAANGGQRPPLNKSDW